MANPEREVVRTETALSLDGRADPAPATYAAPLPVTARAVPGAPDLGRQRREHVAHGHHCLTPAASFAARAS